jgi:hypothetical protein
LDQFGPRGAERASDSPVVNSPVVETAQPAESADSQFENLDADKQAADLELQADQQKRRARRSRKREEIRSELHSMVITNREAGGQGVYAGFRFVRAGANEMSPNEEPYLGAFLPLQVGMKFPGLMAMTTITCEEVFVNEQLDPATRTVVGPGKFRRYDIVSSRAKLNSLLLSSAYLAGALVAAAALVWLALWSGG